MTKWTKGEVSEVLRLRFDEKWEYKAIAEKLRPGQKSAWRKVGEICRKHEKIHKDDKEIPPATPKLDIKKGSVLTQDEVEESLLTMNRDERVRFLMARLKTSARGAAVLSTLDYEQQALFSELYFENIREFDSLTSAEDQMLMQALLAYCHYLRGAQMATEAERAFLMDMRGELLDGDPKKRLAGVADRYKREMETKHKEYVALMDRLKATRDQRLKNVIDQKKTFGEIQREFANKHKRRSIVKEILSIEKMTDDEIKRMLAGGPDLNGEHRPWLIGDFQI